MNWLLVTNYCWEAPNPGDEWARLGVEQILRTVDPAAKFIFRRRDHGREIHWKPAQFDYAVVCSMPGFWSHGSYSSMATHESFGPYTTWLSDRKQLFLAGVGTNFYLNGAWPGTFNVAERIRWRADVDRLLSRCAGVYIRDKLADTTQLFGVHVRAMPCPSIFAGLGFPAVPVKTRKLCNLMRYGTHYPENCGSIQVQTWGSWVKPLAKELIDRGFVFAAHTNAEMRFARELGFQNIIPPISAEVLLREYSGCRQYFGNRVHGAIVARSFGADVTCIGMDTRLAAVDMVGGTAYAPAGTSLDALMHRIRQDGPAAVPEPLEVKYWFDAACAALRTACPAR